MSHTPPLSLLVRKLNNNVALNDDEQQAVLELPHVVRDLKASAYIVRERDVLGHCAVLCRGFAFRHKLVEDGARQILSILLAGDALDLQQLFLDHADHNIQALTDVTVAMVPRAALRALAFDRPAVGRSLMVAMQIEAAISREWLVNVGRREARERIAHLLCEIAVRLNRQSRVAECGYELPMTQEQLGDALGLTSVHVNRMLRTLETDGLIIRRKRTIFIPDWTKLRRMAGFNPAYLHLDQQRAGAAGHGSTAENPISVPA